MLELGHATSDLLQQLKKQDDRDLRSFSKTPEILENLRDGTTSVKPLVSIARRLTLLNTESFTHLAELRRRTSLLDPEKLASIWHQHSERLLLIARSIGKPA